MLRLKRVKIIQISVKIQAILRAILLGMSVMHTSHIVANSYQLDTGEYKAKSETMFYFEELGKSYKYRYSVNISIELDTFVSSANDYDSCEEVDYFCGGMVCFMVSVKENSDGSD